MNLLERIVKEIPPTDRETLRASRERLRNQARPAGSLGLLENVAARLASICGTIDVRLKRKVIVTCAGDHGVCREGVSLFPSDVTRQMVYNFVAGGASINVMARHAGAEVLVADMGVDWDFEPDLPIFHKKVRKGTSNFAEEPAMTYDEAVRSIEAGIEIVDELNQKSPVHLLGTGDMGIGNTSPSSAIIAAFSGLPPSVLTGKGTGLDDEGVKKKAKVIEKALALHRPDPKNPLDVLAKVGGFEIGGIAGLIIGAAHRKIPVVCDGLIATAGALIACELCPDANRYLFSGHRSVEAGHAYMLKHLGQEPLLDLQFRLGEGTGAAMAMELIDMATRILSDIKTFEEVAIADAQS